MTVKLETLSAIQEAHARGLLDSDIAYYAGVSTATVKRGRAQLGLETNCLSNLRGRRGERLVAEAARQQGLHVDWRPYNNACYDLVIEGLLVDVKATLVRADGSLRFRCPLNRPSHFGQYEYTKNLAQDCNVVALAGLTSDERLGYLYLLPSAQMPTNLIIKPGGAFDQHLDDWSLFGPATPVNNPFKA